MTDKPILYVKAGVTPGWRELDVVFKANGRVLRDVIEADAHNGWYVQAVRDAEGMVQRRRDGSMVTKRMIGHVRIVRRCP